MGVVNRRWVWVESMSVVNRRWVWVESMGMDSGVVVRRYIDSLILLIPPRLVSSIFGSSIPLFVHFLESFLFWFRAIFNYRG